MANIWLFIYFNDLDITVISGILCVEIKIYVYTFMSGLLFPITNQ